MSKSPTKHNESEARYMNNDKKRYYLASVDENVQLLVNSQKEELTRILIDLKSEYDTITRETRRRKEEEEHLKQKIKILDQMASKTKKNMEVAVNTNETMKTAKETKNKRKEEETYLKKTQIGQIEKLKSDTLLLKKEINQRESDSRRLDKQIERAKLSQNDIKQRYNSVYSRISSQNQKNKFDNNEQSLQLQYYNTIIDHKSMFIQSADERKQRQKNITQEAKNNSADQIEETNRKQLELLGLYNKYLRHKMERQLHQNEKMEETYLDIRDICGTKELSEIIDMVLMKDKHYNYSVGIVTEQERIRDQLRKDNEELNKELTQLKTEVPVYENRIEEKGILPVNIEVIEKEERELIEIENKLREELEVMEEKQTSIDLIFNKVVENIYLLCKDKAYLGTAENDKEKEKEKEKEDQYNTTGVEDTNINKTTNMNDGLDMTASKKLNLNQDQSLEDNEPRPTINEIDKDKEADKDNENKDNNVSITEQIKAEDKAKVEVVEGEVKETEAKKEATEQQIINLPPEYEDVVHSMNNFLKGTLRRFQMLFLCHSKKEFLTIMREKGIETNQQMMTSQSQRILTTTSVPRKATRRRTNRPPSFRAAPKTEMSSNTKDTREQFRTVYKGEMQYERDEPIQQDERIVFKHFIDEMRKNREEYIKNGPKKE